MASGLVVCFSVQLTFLVSFLKGHCLYDIPIQLSTADSDQSWYLYFTIFSESDRAKNQIINI